MFLCGFFNPRIYFTWSPFSQERERERERGKKETKYDGRSLVFRWEGTCGNPRQSDVGELMMMSQALEREGFVRKEKL